MIWDRSSQMGQIRDIMPNSVAAAFMVFFCTANDSYYDLELYYGCFYALKQ